LEDAQQLIGVPNTRLIVERIIYDLSLTDPALRELQIPERPAEIDLRALGDEEIKAFYFLLAEIGGAVIGEFFKERLLSRTEGRSEEDKNGSSRI